MARLLAPGGYGLLVSEVCDERACQGCTGLGLQEVGFPGGPLRCASASRDALLFDVFGLPGLLRSPDFLAAGVDPLSVTMLRPWWWRQSASRPRYLVAAVAFRSSGAGAAACTGQCAGLLTRGRCYARGAGAPGRAGQRGAARPGRCRGQPGRPTGGDRMPLRACGAAALLLAASPRARCRAGGSRAGAGGAGTARAAGEEPSCLSEGASTSALLRCIAWRQDAGHSGFEAHTPTEEAEDTAMRYMSNLGKDKGGPQAGPISKVHTQHSLEQFSDFMQTGRGLPRIFALDGGQWGRACDWSEESLGYRYSLENYMRTWILGNSGYLVEDMNVADFVYLPHCATGIFMHVVAKEQIERQGQKKRRPRPRPNGSTETTPASEAYLEYEGSLPLRSTRQVDGTYLMGALKSWARVPEFKTCMDRRSCRFLIVSVYGRHVWRNLAGAFGAKAVFLTHAGLSGWLSQQPSDLFLAHASRRRGRQAGAEPACRAICPLHCQREPPPVLQDDVVLPWIVAFGWTRRSGQHPILARHPRVLQRDSEFVCTGEIARHVPQQSRGRVVRKCLWWRHGGEGLDPESVDSCRRSGRSSPSARASAWRPMGIPRIRAAWSRSSCTAACR
ncbi:unnamed protein product [Prorocentrum cordatum]|uniref:Uncharacterized protein n=1 Tax=Prorocentrum cordatum TaxID=2364126 RepID=A0ABN9RZU4_9DINO|nr:unnamed protein product [Polarella glacialis]